MDMSDRLVLALVILVIGVPIAYIMDRNSWRKRPRADLEKMLRGGDWGRTGIALKEIKRRGEDISRYIPVVLALMTSESVTARTAGKLALKDHYPDIAREIPRFEATGPAETRATMLAPLIQKYGIAKMSDKS